MQTLTLEQSHICIRAAYADLDACRNLPGRRWDKARRAWLVPATPAAAQAVLDAFPHADGRDALAAFASTGQHAARLRELGEAVASVPSRLPAWTHQRRGIQLILHQTATYLAHDCGVGKSKCVVDAVCHLAATVLHRDLRVLILAPSSVVSVWPKEFEKHAVQSIEPIVVPLGEGAVAKRTAAAASAIQRGKALNRPVVIVINYEAAWREPMAKFIRDTQWDMMVCDEAHRCKAPGGRLSRFLASARDAADRRVALSGTPMPHSPLDIYAQMRWLDPGVFGTSFTAFRARYARMGGFGGYQVIAYQNQEELQAKFYSLADRVRKQDVLDLPPFVHEERSITLCAATRKAYHELEQTFIADVGDGTVTASNALARLLRLQQMTSGYTVLDDPTGVADPVEVQLGAEKESELTDLLSDDLPGNEPVIVFCRFKHDLAATHRAAGKAGRICLELSGSIKQLADWQQASGGEVLAVQIQSGGVGIDLSRACYCVFYSLTYSLGNFDQALARCHRPGQTRPVTYIHLVAQKTVDDKIYAALERRTEVIQEVLERYRKEQGK